MGKAGDQRLAVERLEFIELGIVDEPGNDLPHVVLLLQVNRHDAVELGSIELRLSWLSQNYITRLRTVQSTDDAATERQCVAIILGVIIGNAGFFRMHVAATQLLGGS